MNTKQNKPLKLNYISDEIKDDHLIKWKKGDTVLLTAQTGTGKTTFIINDLIDSMKENEYILYICNRIELRLQVYIDLMEKYNVDSIEELPKNIHVTSYQSIGEKLIHKEPFNYDTYYKYIVLDECHYFLSDYFTGKTILTFNKFIFEEYHKSIRIFISATMDDLKQLIKDKSKHNCYEYDTGTDYSYLNVKYFKKENDIVQLIKNDSSLDQWIVFVTSIVLGESIKKKLQDKNISCVFINSKNKESPISNGEYKEKVLIATKKIDNGISITSDNVKNIVVYSYDKTTFLQELGRIRVDIKNPRQINLFIPMLDSRSFHTLINTQYTKKQEQLDLYKNDYEKFKRLYKYDTDKIYKDLFYFDDVNNKWIVNKIGMSQHAKHYTFAHNMVQTFLLYKEYAFVYEQLEWLGMKGSFRTDNIIKDVIDNEEVITLENYLNSIEGSKLYKEEQQTLSDMIIKELVTLKSNSKIDYRTKKLKPSTIQTILCDQLGLSYEVSKPKQESKGEHRGQRYITINKIE